MNTTYEIQLTALAQFEAELDKVNTSKNKAQDLYNNGARNILFKLEAICRLQEKITSNSKFEKWKDRFKLLEDQLGQIDFITAVIAHAETNKSSKTLIAQKRKELLAVLAEADNTLQNKKWVENRFKKFKKLLKETDTVLDEKFKTQLQAVLASEAKSIATFYESIDKKIVLIEEHLHEIRRKIRWLSIYVQCYPGVFYYMKPKTMPTWAKPYCTATILKSPFNILKPKLKNIQHLSIQYYNFIACSFVIDKIGKLKDQGLIISQLSKSAAKETQDDTTKKLLLEANKLISKFMENKVLDDLYK